MIGKWRESLDSDGNFGVLLNDLSKAFDCLSHDLLVANGSEQGSDILLKWFTNNLKAGPEKYLLAQIKKDLNAGEIAASNSKCEKLLGIKIDCKLRIDTLAKSLCKKASQKLKHYINHIPERTLRVFSIKIIISHLMNFLKKITPVSSTTETFKNWPQKF